MEYKKQETGNSEQSGKRYEFVPLEQRNVDTGMGVERVGIFDGIYDNYQTDLFLPIIKKIEELSRKTYKEEVNKRPMRIIADHLKAAVFVITEGISPANTEQGYVLRRLVRRAIRFGRKLGIEKPFTSSVAEAVLLIMADVYPEIVGAKKKILDELMEEEEKFSRTLIKGIKEFEKLVSRLKDGDWLSGRQAFFLYETYGFPLELTMEMAKEKRLLVDEGEFKRALKKHQQKSRVGAEKKFAGGLSDHSEIVTKYHTATHLLHAALRQVLGEGVHQIGSNITAERLRFDFTHPDKLTEAEIREVENLINKQIEADLPVKMEIMGIEEAKAAGALAFFEQKYQSQVKVYFIGSFSKEVCGGPHVSSTRLIGEIKIIKEESCGAGKRRIYAA